MFFRIRNGIITGFASHILRARISNTCSRSYVKNRVLDGEFFEEDPAFASGQTSVRIMNKEQDGLFIDSFSEVGFKLNNGVRVMGPIALFPKSVLHWNVPSVKFITEDSLSLFTLLEPKLDILIIGVGERESLAKFDSKLITYLRQKRINIEVLPTDTALSTFNFLNAERRSVAGAFIPPSYIANMGMEEEWESMAENHPDKVGLIDSYALADEEKTDYWIHSYDKMEENMSKHLKIGEGYSDGAESMAMRGEFETRSDADIAKAIKDNLNKEKNDETVSEKSKDPSEDSKK